jgi:hypothetical protein
MYLNAANLLRIQLACSAATIPASILLKVVFARHFGPAGLPWAMVIAYVTFTALPLAALSRRAGFQLGRPIVVDA